MKIFSKNSYNPNFSSRCEAIETARKACRKISVVSPSRLNKFILRSKQIKENDYIYLTYKEDAFNKFKYGRSFFKSEKENTLYNSLYAYYKLNQELGDFRTQWGLSGRDLQLLLKQIFNNHIGNCHEIAKCAELILKLNNIDSACCVPLTTKIYGLDHAVCVFNRDGKEFNGKINNNNTIIVDPWLGIVDFANNALKTIQNCYKQYVGLYNDDTITLSNYIDKTELSQKQIASLKEHFSKNITL